MTNEREPKRSTDRPPIKIIEPMPDTSENVMKSLVTERPKAK